VKMSNCPVCDNASSFTYEKYFQNPSQEKWTYNCFEGKKLAKCVKCETVFTYEVFGEDELNLFYSTLFGSAKQANYNPAAHYEYVPRSFSQVRFIMTSVRLYDGIRVLEIGPNSYGMVPSFSLFCEPAYYYYEQYVYPIIAHYGGERLGNYFSKYEALKLSKNQKMDLVTLSHSLEHFDPSTLNESIAAISLALKDDGCIFIEVPDEYGRNKMPPHTVFFTVESLSILLQKHGFEIIATQLIKDSNTTSHISKNKGSKVLGLTHLSLRILLRMLRSFNWFRKRLLKLLLGHYESKLEVSYDGRPYLRVIGKKIL
jgi:hypothetical protein